MSLARLLQLASPALPVGAYSYSQGLEAAVEAGIVKDASSAEAWISDALELVGRFEVPVLWKMMHGEPLNDFFLAGRETAELRAETLQMGHSLKIGEQYRRYGGTREWPELEAFPTTPWNYGLVLDDKNPARSLELVRKPGPVPANPFTPDVAGFSANKKSWSVNAQLNIPIFDGGLTRARIAEIDLAKTNISPSASQRYCSIVSLGLLVKQRKYAFCSGQAALKGLRLPTVFLSQ